MMARDKFPNAQIVVLTPAPAKAAEIDAISGLSNRVAAAAGGLDYYVINPSAQGWIYAGNIDAVIDPVTLHPSTAGQIVQRHNP